MTRHSISPLFPVVLVAGLLPLLGTTSPLLARDFHNIQFKVPVANGAATEVIGVLGGDDELMLRFFDAGQDMAPSGKGHAWLAAVQGTFDQLTMSAEGNTPGMTAIQMNLHAAGNGSVTFTARAGGNANTDLVLADDAPAEDNSLTFELKRNGQNRITFELPDGSPFTQLSMESDVGVDSIRQVRVAVLPEPLALSAFALAALLLRRRRG